MPLMRFGAPGTTRRLPRSAAALAVRLREIVVDPEARVVHEYLDGQPARLDLRREPVARRGLGEVARQHLGPRRAQLARKRLELVLAARHETQSVAALRELPGE